MIKDLDRDNRPYSPEEEWRPNGADRLSEIRKKSMNARRLDLGYSPPHERKKL